MGCWHGFRLPAGRRRAKSFVEKTVRGLLEATEQALFAEDMAATGGFLQRLDPRVKLVGMGGLIVAAVASHRLWVLAGVLALGVALALASHISLRLLAARVWVAVLAFTGAIALPAIFLTPGTPVWRVPLVEWPVTQQGLRSAGFLVLRAETAATLSTLLILTTLWTQPAARACGTFALPVAIVAILGMTYRYMFLFLATARDMFESRESRIVGVLAAGRPPPPGRRQRGSAAGQDAAGERRSSHGHAGARLSRRDPPARRISDAAPRLAAAGGVRGRWPLWRYGWGR